MPHRRLYFFVCTNRREEGNPKGSCAQSGSEELLKNLKKELALRGLAGEVRACGSTCLDLCEFGASVVQEPAHVVYGRVTAGDIPDLVDAAAEGRVVDRLVVVGPRAGTR
jgi:(2Fe-2S) ferredoxin